MNKLILGTILTFAILLSGCGGGGSHTSPQLSGILKNGGTAQLGNLAGARVRIFEIDDQGKKILKWREKTSSGITLNTIGRFDLHLTELDPDRYYLYKVKGGRDWDADDNGVKDTVPTVNNGVIRAIAKGSDILNAGGDFRVTIVSEIVFERVAEVLKYDFNYTTFGDILKREAASVIDDIDENGVIDNNDVIRFHPVKKHKKLKKHYRKQLKKVLHNVHQGNTAIKIPYAMIASIKKVGFVHKLTLSKDETKVYIAGGEKGLFVVDIKDPSKPIRQDINLTQSGIVLDVAVSSDGRKAFLLEKKRGFVVVIMNKGVSTFLSSYTLEGIPRKITLSKDESKAYIALGSKGLIILDISDPENPLPLGSFRSKRGAVLDMVLSKDETKIYVADAKKGLKIIDASDPTDLFLVGAYKNTGGHAQGIALSNDETMAYIVTGKKGLRIVDLSTIDNPVLMGSCDINGSALDITLSKDEKKAYIATGKKGMTIVDINTSTAPRVIQSVAHKKLSPRNIVLSHDGSKAYLANGGKGLAILGVGE